MGNISGSIIAKCIKCNCKFTWHTNSMPFVDSEFIGTCENCANEQTHICVDETQKTKDGCFKEVGIKCFNHSKNHFSNINNKLDEYLQKYIEDKNLQKYIGDKNDE